MSRSTLLSLVAAGLLLGSGLTARAQTGTTDPEAGTIALKRIRAGSYLQYLPRQEPRGVLVIVHGMPSAEEANNIAGLAEKFLKRWSEFAEAHRLIAVAPVFDAENFDSVKGDHGGGYRGLFGRVVGADEFVNQIVAPYKSRIKSWDGRILLYGHSAGGQFTNHYCVRHPNRIQAAVIGSAGGYAFPDPSVHWPHGMGPWRTNFQWDPNQSPQPVNVRPDPAGWLKAAGLPILVVVGAEDLEKQKPRAGHDGSTRVEYGEQWVKALNRFAQRQRKPGNVRMVTVPGVGHDSAKLTPTAQKFFEDVLKPSE